MAHHVVFLWFGGCPNHRVARAVVQDLLRRLAPDATFEDVDATDAAVAERHRFPGSPTVRIDGTDVEPGFADPGDYTPRCRLYRTAAGLSGVPDPAWIEALLKAR